MVALRTYACKAASGFGVLGFDVGFGVKGLSVLVFEGLNLNP